MSKHLRKINLNVSMMHRRRTHDENRKQNTKSFFAWSALRLTQNCGSKPLRGLRELELNGVRASRQIVTGAVSA